MDKKLSKEEMLKIVEKLSNGEGDDIESSEWIEALERNTGCLDISDYIFWNNEDLTPEQILEKALSYKPIVI